MHYAYAWLAGSYSSKQHATGTDRRCIEEGYSAHSMRMCSRQARDAGVAECARERLGAVMFERPGTVTFEADEGVRNW